MIKEAIAKLVEGVPLAEAEAEEVMEEIMDGRATPAQIGAYLAALRIRGETAEVVTGSARVMRRKALRIQCNDPLVVDTCGTGGDRLHTFNISTAAAFVVAGLDIRVAKHGNRSISSRSGSADVLKALGVQIELDTARVSACLEEVGIAFLFAPRFHRAMKHAMAPRQEIGIRSLFNLLGPLTNPAGATIQVLGVYDDALVDLLARALVNLGARHCFIVHGADGLDEVSITGPTRVCEGKEGRISCYHIHPGDFGMRVASLKDIAGGTPEENARILLGVLAGEKGPRRDIVLLNAAPAIVACGRADSLQEAVRLAAHAIDSGAAMKKLEALRAFTNP